MNLSREEIVRRIAIAQDLLRLPDEPYEIGERKRAAAMLLNGARLGLLLAVDVNDTHKERCSIETCGGYGTGCGKTISREIRSEADTLLGLSEGEGK